MVASSVLIASVTGIVVSGVVGPAATSWGARRAARRQFIRDQVAHRRDDLRGLLDDAAAVLGVGPIRLRETWEAAQAGTMNEGLRDWPDEVYVLGQRLRLRLDPADPIVTRYEAVRAALQDVGQIRPGSDEQRYEAAVTAFETARDAFLAASLARLDAPLREKESG